MPIVQLQLPNMTVQICMLFMGGLGRFGCTRYLALGVRHFTAVMIVIISRLKLLHWVKPWTLPTDIFVE